MGSLRFSYPLVSRGISAVAIPPTVSVSTVRNWRLGYGLPPPFCIQPFSLTGLRASEGEGLTCIDWGK